MRQLRVLLYAHDGSGLGHLRRISRVAGALQGPCAALVVCGLKPAAWIVPEPCEVLRMPPWDSMIAARAASHGREVWWDAKPKDAQRLRHGLLESIFSSFAPDAVIVDYRPFGKRDELAPFLASSKARKYLLLRGIIDTSDYDIFYGPATRSFSGVYDRILVASDARVVDVAREYAFEAEAAAKLKYVGYIVPDAAPRDAARRARGMAAGRQWVVCSAGGGIRAEPLLAQCVRLAARLPSVDFDVVGGPRARLKLDAPAPPNCRVHGECPSLPEMHAAADVVVGTGGYNSVMEAAMGGARILVCPNQLGSDDEQLTHAARLSRFYPIRALGSQEDLEAALRGELALVQQGAPPAFSLKKDGAQELRRLLLADLGQA